MQIPKKVRRSDFEFQAVVEGPNLNFVNMFEGPTLNFENPSRSELKFRENADVQMWIDKIIITLQYKTMEAVDAR